MQTPAHRKRLIAEGRYTELEPPPNLGFGFKRGFPAAPQAVQQVFGTTERALPPEREPGEEG
jgi:hypothetical protein